MTLPAKPGQSSPGIQSDHSLYTGLKVALPFWEGSGTTVTGKGPNAHVGTLNGNCAWVDGGAVGHAVHFDGSAGCNISIPNHADFGELTDYTMLVVARPTEFTPARYGIAFHLGQGATNGTGVNIDTHANDGGIWRADGRAGGAYDPCNGAVGTPPTEGTWVVVGARRAGSTINVHIDGVDTRGDTSTEGTAISTTVDLFLGTQERGGSGFIGDIAACLLWNRALTDAELLEVAEDPWAVFRSLGGPRKHFDISATAAQESDSIEYGVLELVNGNAEAYMRWRTIDTATGVGSWNETMGTTTIPLRYAYTGASCIIACLSDTHMGHAYSPTPTQSLDWVVADLNANIHPDYCFWLGDIIHDGNAAQGVIDMEYALFTGLRDQVTGVTSHHYVRGNHDDPTTFDSVLGTAADDACSKLSLGNIDFVFISVPAFASSTPSAAARTYLTNAIAALGASDNMILCSHHGTYDTTRSTTVAEGHMNDETVIAAITDGCTAWIVHIHGHGHGFALTDPPSVATCIADADIILPEAWPWSLGATFPVKHTLNAVETDDDMDTDGGYATGPEYALLGSIPSITWTGNDIPAGSVQYRLGGAGKPWKLCPAMTGNAHTFAGGIFVMSTIEWRFRLESGTVFDDLSVACSDMASRRGGEARAH